jgi:hypothetical protein
VANQREIKLMWLLIVIVFALLLAAVGSVFAGGIFSIIAVPIGLLGAAAAVVWFVRSGRDANAPQVVPSATEPTGTPRSGSSGAETANQRVGQA